MARVFTTSFVFNQQTYNAIVTLISREGILSFTIHVIDVDLTGSIPGGLIKMECREGFRDLEVVSKDLSYSMVQSITAAIETHLVHNS